MLNEVVMREWCQACTGCQMRRWELGQEMLLATVSVADLLRNHKAVSRVLLSTDSHNDLFIWLRSIFW